MDFRHFSTIPAPATPFLLPGVITDLPRRCWNEEEGRRDRDRRSAAISLRTSLWHSSSFQHRWGRSEITSERRNGVVDAGMVGKWRKSVQKTCPNVRS
ncbi:hypothetical protein ACLB2K_065608 [Fragaria x ananassa]